MHRILNIIKRSNSCGNKFPRWLQKQRMLSIHLRTLGLWGSKRPTEWNKAVSDAEKLVGYPTSLMGLRCLLSDEISNVAMRMRKLVGSKHPLLKTARGLIYNDKHTLQTRGLIVLLICKAAGQPLENGLEHEIDNNQRTLAEITEMIYTASLIHKGVVNLSEYGTSPDDVKEDMESGNKMAALTGDFMLANACTELASLCNTKVVENISLAIGNSMEAEFTKLKNSSTDLKFSDWLDHTYLSSGSLLANSCKSALMLVGHNEAYQTAAYEFGRNLAITRQLYEDINRYLQPENDIFDSAMLTTAPAILFQGNSSVDITQESLEHPDEQKQIFKKIKESEEFKECKNYCKQYGIQARHALHVFEHSPPRDALFKIVNATTIS